MAESILIGAGIGAGTSMLTGNDPLKGAMIGGATGGVASGVSGGAASGAEGVTSTVPSHLTSDAVSSTVANGTMNPALTNGLGQSSNPFTQFSRDAYENVGQHVDGAFNSVTDTIGGGFDYLNDKTGMENKDWTQMAMTQGINSMQPNPQQPITHAVPQIMKQQYEPTQAQSEGMLTSNPRINQELRKRGLL